MITFTQHTTANGAKILTWNMPDSSVFYIDFRFNLSSKTLPPEYDQALHLMEHMLDANFLQVSQYGRDD